MGTLTYAAGAGFILVLALFFMVIQLKKRISLNRKLKGLIDTRGQYDFLLCDIRSQDEYERGHIPGAVSFPLKELTYLPVEDMFLTIVVYGKKKSDSKKAAKYLSTNGYFNVISYGKIKRWRGALAETDGLHISKFPSKKESKYDIQEIDTPSI